MLANSSHRAERKCPICSYGKLKLHNVCGMTADVLVAFTKLLEGSEPSQHTKQQNTSCCVNGTMKTSLRTACILITPPLASKSWCIGSATSALRESCTNRQEAGCLYCAGRRVCECNSLQTHYSMFSVEWDFARNDMTPWPAHQVVWWVNSVRGSWAQRINGHTHPRFNRK